MIRAAAFITTLALPAQAADYEFCWFGANGYVMEGRMTIADTATSNPRITENDVTAFSIQGTRNGFTIGQWSLADLTPQTSWNLNFDTTTSTFVTGGSTSSTEGQEWNANGRVNNCGASGFGFNSGSGGQDVCIKNTYHIDSSINEFTPFPAYPLGTGPACTDTPLLGSLHGQPPPLTRAALR